MEWNKFGFMSLSDGHEQCENFGKKLAGEGEDDDLISHMQGEECGHFDFFDDAQMNFFDTAKAPISAASNCTSSPPLSHDLARLKKNREFQSLILDYVNFLENEEVYLASTKNTLYKFSKVKKVSSSHSSINPVLPKDINIFASGKQEEKKLVNKDPKWSRSEKESLQKAIIQHNQFIFLDRFSQNFARSKAASLVERLPQQKLLENTKDIDWNIIRSLCGRSFGRTAVDCQIQWMCSQHPSINHASFRELEIQKIISQLQSLGPGKWAEISDSLQNNRTPWQCLTAYVKYVRGKGLRNTRNSNKGKWSAQEDVKLEAAVQQYPNNWQKISEMLPGRTHVQCAHRWSKNLDSTKKTGRWSKSEDEWIRFAIKRFGCNNWNIICKFVPSRTDVQCRERWVNILDPFIETSPFTPEEDQKLLEAVKKHGTGKWSLISGMFETRTDSICRRRYLSLSSPNTSKAPMGRPKRKRQK